jgi:hypothetical protein
MSTILKKAVDSIKHFPAIKASAKRNISEELLGKYCDIIPAETTSTEFIKKLRSTKHYKVNE